MVPLIIAGLAFVSIGGSVLAYLLDRKSEEEVERREFLTREHESAVRAQQADRGERIRAYFRKLAAEAERLRQERWEVKTALHDHVKRLRANLKEEQFTPNRRRALTLLARTMEEKREQAYAEAAYLGRLSQRLGTAASDWDDQVLVDLLPNVSETILDLPVDWPWTGRVISMGCSENDDNPIRPRVPFLFFEDGGDLPEGVPVFVGPNDRERRAYLVSAAKAALKEVVLSAPGAGVFATIRRVEENEALLEVSGVPLFLPQRERKGGPLVVGAELLVYPLDWKFDLSEFRPRNGPAHVVRVTEFRESAMGESCFDSVPLLVADEMAENFAAHCMSVAESSDPWIIEPVDPQSPLDGRLVLSNGSVAVRACIDTYGGKHVIRLEGLVPHDEPVPEREIYCVLPVSVLQIDEGWLEVASQSELEEAGAQCQEFALFVHDEFSRQERIVKGAAGQNYIRRWLDVAQALVDTKSKADKGVAVRLLCIASSRGRFTEYVIDAQEQVERYMSQHLAAADASMRRGPDFMLMVGNTVVGSGATITSEGWLKVRAAVTGVVLPEDEVVKAILVARTYPHTDIQQMRALDIARRGDSENPVVLDAVISPEMVRPDPNCEWEMVSPSAEFAQGLPRTLLEAALKERNLFCIQGPPGTGKTTLIVELIRQHLSRYPWSRILVASQANVAVDEVLTRLASKHGADPLVRIGNPDKLSAEVKDLAIDIDARHLQYQTLLRNLDVPERLNPMRDFWLEECGGDLSPDLVELLLTRHQVVGATCLGLTRRQVSLMRPFDLVLIDEAARATPGELMIPMLRGRKVVMIGDHKQLPPTVDPAFRDEEAPLAVGPSDVRRMYAETLFERLFIGLPQEMTGRLLTQYRMPPMIGNIVAEMFYPEDSLTTFKDNEPLIAFRRPLRWLDTSRMEGWRGEPPKSGQSLVNHGEVELVIALLEAITGASADLHMQPDIAVITCYSAQKSELIKRVSSSRLKRCGIAIDTVDSFQGNQADIVIYCTTRSHGSIRFLNDPNRLNVALSRTKREFLLVGDPALLCRPLKDGSANHFARLRQAMGPAGIAQARTVNEAVRMLLLPSLTNALMHLDSI